MDKIYQEELLEYYKYPRFRQVIANPDFYQKDFNPSCGDLVEMMGTLQGDYVVSIGFQGKGCVISQASAAMLTEAVLNKSVDEILALTHDDVVKMIKIELGPVRFKCALLALQALQQALQASRKA